MKNALYKGTSWAEALLNSEKKQAHGLSHCQIIFVQAVSQYKILSNNDSYNGAGSKSVDLVAHDSLLS